MVKELQQPTYLATYVQFLDGIIPILAPNRRNGARNQRRHLGNIFLERLQDVIHRNLLPCVPPTVVIRRHCDQRVANTRLFRQNQLQNQPIPHGFS